MSTSSDEVTSECRCCNNVRAAGRDMMMACERIIGAHIFDEDTKKWFDAYRNGIAAFQNRYDKAGGFEYCPHNKKDPKP